MILFDLYFSLDVFVCKGNTFFFYNKINNNIFTIKTAKTVCLMTKDSGEAPKGGG